MGKEEIPRIGFPEMTGLRLGYNESSLRSPMDEQSQPQLEFPLLFPLRIIGEEAEDFEEFVLEIVRRHVPDLLSENVVSRLSREQRYRSISVEFIAQNRAQVDNLCQELSQHKRIKMLL
jgi:putative lipoic acid-binding regulatory protein